MNKEEIENKIKELQEQLKDIDKIDFSEFICRCHDILAIKGKKLLKSLPNGDMNYNNLYPTIYNDKVDYEVVNISNLVKGDIFILDNLIKFELNDFMSYIGKTSNKFLYHYLKEYENLEYVGSNYWIKNYKVKRFLRE